MTYSKLNLRRKHNIPPAWVIGYTTREHLCIDLDNTSYTKVHGLVEMLMYEYPEIGACLIMESSTRRFHQQINYTPPKGVRIQTKRNNYHAIFDNHISYDHSCKIIETLAHLGVLDEAYTRIRQLRNDMTLRVNKTVLVDQIKSAPYPLIVLPNRYTEKRDGYIEVFLNFSLLSRHL